MQGLYWMMLRILPLGLRNALLTRKVSMPDQIAYCTPANGKSLLEYT